MKVITQLDFDPEDLAGSGLHRSSNPEAWSDRDQLIAVPSEDYPSALAEIVATYRKSLHLPDDAGILVSLGAVVANRIPGLSPCWVMLVAASSTGKTSQLEPLMALDGVVAASTLTEAGLLSGVATQDRTPDATGGLLRVIGERGVLVVKDFTSILSGGAENKQRVLAALREIYDGQWDRILGSDGGRSFSWKGHLGLVAACTPVIDRHHGVMQVLGERFLYLRLRDIDPVAQARAAISGTHARPLREVVGKFVSTLPAVGTDPDAEEAEFIAQLAVLTAPMRSTTDRDGYRREIEVTPEAEAPARLAKAFRALWAGFQLIGVPRHRRLQLLWRVAFDSMPEARRRAVLALYASESTLGIGALMLHAKVSETATRRHLEDIKAFGIVRIEPPRPGERKDPYRLSLTDETREHMRQLLNLAGMDKGQRP